MVQGGSPSAVQKQKFRQSTMSDHRAASPGGPANPNSAGIGAGYDVRRVHPIRPSVDCRGVDSYMPGQFGNPSGSSANVIYPLVG